MTRVMHYVSPCKSTSMFFFLFFFSTEVSMTEASKIGSTADRYKVMIIVGVNIGILILAGLIGMMCYNKRTYQEIYHKVPGIDINQSLG